MSYDRLSVAAHFLCGKAKQIKVKLASCLQFKTSVMLWNHPLTTPSNMFKDHLHILCTRFLFSVAQQCTLSLPSQRLRLVFVPCFPVHLTLSVLLANAVLFDRVHHMRSYAPSVCLLYFPFTPLGRVFAALLARSPTTQHNHSWFFFCQLITIFAHVQPEGHFLSLCLLSTPRRIICPAMPLYGLPCEGTHFVCLTCALLKIRLESIVFQWPMRSWRR